MKLDDLKNKKILIIGLGREGLATLKYLSKNLPEQKFSVADKNVIENLPENIDQKFFGNDHLKHLNEFDVVIKSPGISHLVPEIADYIGSGKTITSATNIFFANFKGKIIGVTGTKGKSTTAALTFEVLQAGGVKSQLVGNIGIPALESLDQLDPDTTVVYELSSHQLYDIKYSPHISILTNIYPEHLDYYENFAQYLSAKGNITKYQTSQDYVIYNQSFPELKKLGESSKAIRLPFSLEDLQGSACFWDGDQTICRIGETQVIFDNDENPLKGDFNLQNIMPAILVGMLFDISSENIKKGVAGFTPLPHRLEYVGKFKEIEFYNDSLSTVPQTTIAALQALPDTETLIAGGFDRGVDYDVLGEAIVKSKVKNLILFPTTGEKIWQAIERFTIQDSRFKKFDVQNMEEAVKIAYEVTEPGKIVLLSPASTSFNTFKDYADRGEQFKKYVSELGID